MEYTNNKLNKNTRQFFHRLSKYLDEKIYFYGSVQRMDYIPGKSDIDVCIFTDNEYSTMAKLQHFLHVKKNEFVPVVKKYSNGIVYGYKIKYTHPTQPLEVEFSVYNTKFKQLILRDHITKTKIPFYIGWILYFIKWLYYEIPILTAKRYAKIKDYLLSYAYSEKETNIFLLLR